jgi:hypothetical protein
MRKSFIKCLLFILVLVVALTQYSGQKQDFYAASANLALGKTITVDNNTQTFAATNANDGDVNTYWEGAANTYPNILTVDLGSSLTFNTFTLKLNPTTSWATRTQTVSILGSTDNVTYSKILNSAEYTFNPATGNTVTINFEPTAKRYVRLEITANKGSTGGQIAEFEIYNSVVTPTPTLTPGP